MERFYFKLSIWFLCLSHIFIGEGFLPNLSWGQNKKLPIGQIIARGEVQFSLKENIWKDIEPAYFPLFSGMKIKTRKGLANIFLKNHSHVELSKDTMILITGMDNIRLLQGKIDFRIPARANFKMHLGNLLIQKASSQLADQGTHLAGEEVIGELNLTAHGAMKISLIKGKISVINHEQQVLAALSQRDSLTIPASLVNQPLQEKIIPLKIAQVGEEELAAEPEKYAGISAKTWGIIGLAALGATGALIAAGGGGGGGGGAPACP